MTTSSKATAIAVTTDVAFERIADKLEVQYDKLVKDSNEHNRTKQLVNAAGKIISAHRGRLESAKFLR